MTASSRTGAATLAAFAGFTAFAIRCATLREPGFASGRAAGAARRALWVLALTGLPAPLRIPVALAVRRAGLAALAIFRAAGALRAAAFLAGFLVLGAFLAGINFSGADSIERRIIVLAPTRSSGTVIDPAGTLRAHGRLTGSAAVQPLRRCSATIVV